MNTYKFKLGNGEVHIWQASLQSFSMPSQQSQLFQYLTEDERSRADRYVNSQDRTRFIIARGVLRSLLGRYLTTNPAHIVLEYGTHGKPILLSPAQDLHFNVSHTGERIACIFARDRDVGIDIEYMRDNLDIHAIAERFFSEDEFSRLKNLPQEAKITTFFSIWTKKEAFIKAMGTGLFYSLRQCDVTALATDGEWSLQAFDPGVGYAGAWAMRGKVETVSYFEFPNFEKSSFAI